MQKRLSRRELLRRTEQGREAMRVLAAAVVTAGGRIRIPRDTYEGLPRNHKVNVIREDLTDDLILEATVPGQGAAPVVEMTFEEIRAKYGDKRTAESVSEAAPEAAGSSVGGVLPGGEGEGIPDQES
jgi:hypothetical protein